MTVNKLVLIGLDGATFDLINPWIEDGSLPNLEEISENGVKTVLQSCRPPVTSQAWKVFSTGFNPGNLGTFWWRQLNRDTYGMDYSGGRNHFDKKNMWDYLSENNFKVGVIGTPLTYPAYPLNGFYVAGGPFARDEEDSNYAYPEELEGTLEKKFNYKVEPEINLAGEKESERFEEGNKVINSRFEAGRHLYEEYDPDFTIVTTFFLNQMQHNWWKDEKIKEYWKNIDSYIGEYIDDGVNVVLVSDHGLQPVDKEFYLGSWLAEEGYTVFEERENKKGITALDKLYNKLRTISHKVPVPSSVVKYGGKIFRRLGAKKDSNQVREASKYEEVIDYEKSRVIGFPQGNMYIINCDDREREKIKKEIKEKLEGLRDDGNNVVKKVYEREDIYAGEYMDKAPDLYAEPAENFRIKQGTTEDFRKGVLIADCANDTTDWRATNHREGILMAHGPDIGTNSNLDANLKDIAPTILHYYGLPIPKNMDGKVLKELFAEDSEAYRREIKKEDINTKMLK